MHAVKKVLHSTFNGFISDRLMRLVAQELLKFAVPAIFSEDSQRWFRKHDDICFCRPALRLATVCSERVV